MVCGGYSDPVRSTEKTPVSTHGLVLWDSLQITPKSWVLLATPCAKQLPWQWVWASSAAFSTHACLAAWFTNNTTLPSTPPPSKCYLLVFSAQFAIALKRSLALLNRCLHFACRLFSYLLSDALVKPKFVSVLAVASLQGVCLLPTLEYSGVWTGWQEDALVKNYLSWAVPLPTSNRSHLLMPDAKKPLGASALPPPYVAICRITGHLFVSLKIYRISPPWNLFHFFLFSYTSY